MMLSFFAYFRTLKKAIRAPNDAMSLVTESHTANFLVNQAERVISSHGQWPPVVVAIVEMLFKRTPFGRVIDILRRAQAKRKHEEEVNRLKKQITHEHDKKSV